MKMLLILSLMISSLSVFASDCGKVISMSIVGDHGDDWVAGATVKLPESFVRATTSNSPNFLHYLTKEVMSVGYETTGFFVCLDDYTTYNRGERVFANVTGYRIYRNGVKLVDSKEVDQIYVD